jgi:hypothetical protein
MLFIYIFIIIVNGCDLCIIEESSAYSSLELKQLTRFSASSYFASSIQSIRCYNKPIHGVNIYGETWSSLSISKYSAIQSYEPTQTYYGRFTAEIVLYDDYYSGHIETHSNWFYNDKLLCDLINMAIIFNKNRYDILNDDRKYDPIFITGYHLEQHKVLIIIPWTQKINIDELHKHHIHYFGYNVTHLIFIVNTHYNRN